MTNNSKDQIENKLFVLAGPSAVGKSTVLSKIIDEGLCKLATKYSDREDRKKILFDDIESVAKNKMHEFCDVVIYEMYGNLYGFNIDKINKELCESHLITICSDFTSVKKMKKLFKKNFSAVFIYLQNIMVENLLKAFAERKKKKFDKELFELAKKLSEALKTENKLEYIGLEKSFKNMLKGHLLITDYEEFNKRYEGLINFNKRYEKNKKLFDHTVSGKNTDELIEQCRNIIKKQKDA